MDSSHVAAALQTLGQITVNVVRSRILHQEHNRAETNDEGQDVEVTDPNRCPTHRLTGFFGIRYREEAHQDVWQTSRTEHQRHTHRDCRDRIFDQATWGHQCIMLRMDFNSLGEQRFWAETEGKQHSSCHEGSARQQHHSLDHLNPGGGRHTAEQYVHHHQDAHEHHSNGVVQTKQNLDQLTSTHHLGNHVEGNHNQRTRCSEDTHRGLREAVRGHVSKGELAEVTQTLCQQEGDDWPTNQPADREDQAVKAVSKHQTGNTQERSSRHVVASNRQAVLETGDTATSRVEVSSGLCFARSPLGDVEREQNEDAEHDDGSPVRGLLGGVTQIRTCGQRCTTREECAQRNKSFIHFGHFCTSLTRASFSASKSVLALRT